MQFAEYYMAVKASYENPNLKLIFLDRTLAGDVGHLMWSVNELVRERRCVLEEIETEFGTVSTADLELCRILQPNDQLRIPTARSHFIKYEASLDVKRDVFFEGKILYICNGVLCSPDKCFVFLGEFCNKKTPLFCR